MTAPPRALRHHAPPSRGILRQWKADAPQQRLRVLPPEELAPYVHHFWSLRWSVTAPIVTEALPYPCVSVVFEELAGVARAEIAGPRTSRVTKVVVGEGRVFGLTFRPGAFAPLAEGSMAKLTNRVVPVGAVFGARGERWAEATHAEPEVDGRIALATAFLEPLLPPLPKEVERVRDLVEAMASDRSILKVDDAYGASGLDARTLQRHFRRFVGVSPKWALQRFRLLEAVERLKAPNPPSLAELAASLEYADQAHFARDFRRMIGETPRRFVARFHGEGDEEERGERAPPFARER